MEPKGQKKAVVKTTRKVVKKTVEVSVVQEEGNNHIETLENPLPMIVEEVSVEKSGVELITVVKSPFREENTGKEKADQNDDVVDDTVDVEVERSKAGGKEREMHGEKNMEGMEAREIPVHVKIMNANEEGNMDEDDSRRENTETRKRVSGDEIRDIETQTPEETDGEEEEVVASPDETEKQKRKTVDLSMEETEDSREPETPKKIDVRPNNMTTPEKSKRKRRKRNGIPSRGDVGMGGIGGYKTYVYRVLKQVHPTLGMSSRAMDVLDMMMADMFERLAGEAAKLSKYTGKQTITSREVHNAVRLVLPGELGKHAISEGARAVSNYMKDI